MGHGAPVDFIKAIAGGFGFVLVFRFHPGHVPAPGLV